MTAIHRAPTGHRCGESHPKTRLTDDQVRQMRADYWPYARGKGYHSLAKRYLCSESTARDICTFRTRKKVK